MSNLPFSLSLKSIKTAVKQLFRRLDQSDNNIKISSLELLQSCMNECGAAFHAEVGRKMKTMERLCTSSKHSVFIQKKACEMVAKWGRSIKPYGVLQVFNQTFQELRRKGVRFPEKDEGAPMFSPPATSSPKPQIVQAKPAKDDQRSRAFSSAEFIPKLDVDLGVVRTRLNLCVEMFASMTVASSPGEILIEGLDFLDQCVPRLKRLINSSVSGKIKLSEKTVGVLFSLNDEVNTLLNTFVNAERNGFLDLEKAKFLLKKLKTRASKEPLMEEEEEEEISSKDEDDEEEDDKQDPKVPVAAPKVQKQESVDHGDLLADVFGDVPSTFVSNEGSTTTTTATETDLDDLFGLTE